MLNTNLNPLFRDLHPSATITINELSQKLISDRKQIYKLGFGQSPFPVPERIVSSLKANAHQKDYLPTKGLPALRSEIAQFFKRNYELSTDSEDIMIGPGSKELLYHFQLAYHFEELLLPAPSWVSYEPQAVLTGHKVVWLPTNEMNDWKINIDTIIDHCQTNPDIRRVIILNYPSNPLGVTYSEDELKELAGAFRKYNILVVADEIYGEVHHEGKHHTIAKYYPEGTIISTGLSKWAGAGGWRLGVFIIPKELKYLVNAMATIASETFTSVSAPIQYAAVQAYKSDPSIDTYLVNSRKLLKVIGGFVYTQLCEIELTMPKPEGGFYLFPNFKNFRKALNNKGVNTATDLCNVLLKETGVALLPGEAFGLAKEHITARLSYVDFDGEKLLAMLDKNPSLELDHQFVENHCPQIVGATKKIRSWVESL